VNADYREPAGGTPTGRVLVYREEFLQPSETFIRDHLLEMPRYAVAGLANERLEPGLQMPGLPVHLTRARGVVGRGVQFLGYRARVPRARMIGLAGAATLRRLRPDLVHAHFGPDAALIAAAAARTGTPLVATFHGYDLTKDPTALRGARLSYDLYLDQGPRLLDQLAGIITVSGFLRDILVDRGVDPARIDVIPCGVDTDSIEATPPVPGGPVVFVGRLTGKKGVEDLIRATASMTDPPDLVVIGDGPLRAELTRLAENLRVAVDFRGARSSAEVAAAIRGSSMVVMPSRRAPTGDSEGLGVVALEAAAAGRPVVGYAHGGLPDAVLDGVTGRLVPEGDVPALSRAMASVRADHALAERLGRAGRGHVENHFQRRDLLNRVADVYDRVLATARADGPQRRPGGPVPGRPRSQ